jgi:hypothetical protein
LAGALPRCGFGSRPSACVLKPDRHTVPGVYMLASAGSELHGT